MSFLLTSVLVCLLLPGPPAGDEVPSDEMMTIMNSLYDQYRSLSCDYRVQSSSPGESYSGKYYLEVGKRLRSICDRSDTGRQDLLIKNGVRYDYTPRTLTLQITVHPSTDPLFSDSGMGDLWSMMGLFTAGAKQGVGITYPELMRDNQIRKRSSYDTERNIILEIERNYGTSRVLFSRKHGYLPLSIQGEGTVGQLREQGETRTDAFGFFNGVFMPTKRTSRSTVGGKEEVREFIFSNIKINETIPEENFRDHTCPPGTRVVDAIHQVIDKIDANGQRARTTWKFVDAKQNNVSGAQADVKQTETEETGSYLLTVLPVASLLIALVALVLYLRRR